MSAPKRTNLFHPAVGLLAVMICSSVLGADGFQSYGGSGRQHPFVESMQLMMNALGLDKGNAAGMFDSPWSQFGPVPGTDMMSPWSSGSSQMQQMMNNWPQFDRTDSLGQFGQQWKNAAQGMAMLTSPLNGVWRGRSGELLVISGNQYRIQAGRGRAVQGQLQVRRNHLWLQNSQTKRVNQYEFAAHQGRLVLRDQHGQLLLYRRLENTRNQGWGEK